MTGPKNLQLSATLVPNSSPIQSGTTGIVLEKSLRETGSELGPKRDSNGRLIDVQNTFQKCDKTAIGLADVAYVVLETQQW